MSRERSTDDGAARIPRLISGLGLVLFGLIVVEWVVLDLLQPAVNLTTDYLFAFILSGIPALGVVYGGYRLGRNDVEPDQYRRVARWCVGGLVLFLTLNLAMIAIWPADSFRFNLGWARGTAIYGAVGGVAIGMIEARAVRRARVAEREAARIEHLEDQRRWLDYMNSLLRHEVLNTANVIEGYAELLIDGDWDDPSRERLETIRRHSRNMSGVINDVRVLIEATEGVDEFETVNLSDVLTDRLIHLRTTYDDVEIETAIPGHVLVMGDDLLPRVFSNLLNNAVEHNDSDTPRVTVSVETDGDTALVHIADNGPGIPDRTRETLFERDTSTSNHGLGLYLVRTLSERYGGAVELRETGPEGSVFAVELPLASDGRADRTVKEASESPATAGATGIGTLRETPESF